MKTHFLDIDSIVKIEDLRLVDDTIKFNRNGDEERTRAYNLRVTSEKQCEFLLTAFFKSSCLEEYYELTISILKKAKEMFGFLSYPIAVISITENIKERLITGVKIYIYMRNGRDFFDGLVEKQLDVINHSLREMDISNDKVEGICKYYWENGFMLEAIGVNFADDNKVDFKVYFKPDPNIE